jgi:hypothetical protein
MGRHVCAMILLGGWVLVIPPSSNGGARVDLDAPIRTWLRYAAYDTQEECLQAQFNARNNTFDDKADAATSTETKRHVTYGRCVPAESVDPRK